MQFSFIRFKLKEEPLTYTGITAQCWKAVSSKKLSPSTATDMHFLSSCGYFSCGLLRWQKEKIAVLNKSWKTCLRRYVNEIAFLLLGLTEFIQLAINISTSYMAKNIRSRNGFTSYIYFQTSGIYTSSLRITVPRKVQIAKIWGPMPLNISFMTKLGLKVVIIAKMIYSVKVKMCQFICNAQIHAHIYLNNTLRDVLGRVWLQVDSSEKATLGVGLILCQSCYYGYHHYHCNIYLKLGFH